MLSKYSFENCVSRQRVLDARLLEYAHLNRQKGFFNDISIKVEDDVIFANRMVLSCYSGYFEQILRSEKVENSWIEIKDVDKQSLIILVEFIYTGNLVLDNENVMKVLSTATQFEIEEAKQFCFEFLVPRISTKNCFHFLDMANVYKSDFLKEKVFEIISKNFNETTKSSGFRNLTKYDVILCIKSLNRDYVKESEIYEAIIRWAKHSEAIRMKSVPDLLKLLRLDQLPTEYWLYVVSEENLIKENLGCSNFVMNNLSKILKEKQLKGGGSKLLSVGGNNSPTKVFEVFNLFGEEKSRFPDLPVKLKQHGCVVADNVIYCIGGCDSNEWKVVSRRVFQMNLKLRQLKWEEIAPMINDNCEMGATNFNGTLVVAGGSDGLESIPNVQIYIKPLDEWKEISPLQQSRAGNILVSCDGSLYAIGGWSTCRGVEPLKAVERLTNLKGTWKNVSPMLSSRCWFAAVNYKDSIYVFGGTSETAETALKSAEKYIPVNDKWSFVCSMHYERTGHAACVLRDKIFVVGGIDNLGNVVNQIECYDPLHDVWSIVGKTEIDLLDHALVVV